MAQGSQEEEEDYSIDNDDDYSEDVSNNAPLGSLQYEKPKLAASPSKQMI